MEKKTGTIVLLNQKKIVPAHKNLLGLNQKLTAVVSANFKKNATVALDYISNRVYPGEDNEWNVSFHGLNKKLR